MLCLTNHLKCRWDIMRESIKYIHPPTHPFNHWADPSRDSPDIEPHNFLMSTASHTRSQREAREGKFVYITLNHTYFTLLILGEETKLRNKVTPQACAISNHLPGALCPRPSAVSLEEQSRSSPMSFRIIQNSASEIKLPTAASKKWCRQRALI